VVELSLSVTKEAARQGGAAAAAADSEQVPVTEHLRQASELRKAGSFADAGVHYARALAHPEVP
jgi:hypothetical protein